MNITGKITEQLNPLLASMSFTETVGATNLPVRGIVTADTMYVKLNGTSLGMPSALAHKWFKVSLNQLGDGSVIAKLMHSIQNDNPLWQAQMLMAAEHIRAVGTQTVGGVSTTHYVGWLMPSEAAKYLTPSLRAALAPALKLITGRIGVTVWIDGQRRIRKLIYIEQVASNTLTVVCNLYRFNQPVRIALPPASQVVTLPASALSGG